MVLFHTTLQLPLLRDYLNITQQARRKTSSRAACHAPPTSLSLCIWATNGYASCCSEHSHPRRDLRSPGSLQQAANTPQAGLVPGTGTNSLDAIGSKGSKLLSWPVPHKNLEKRLINMTRIQQPWGWRTQDRQDVARLSSQEKPSPAAQGKEQEPQFRDLGNHRAVQLQHSLPSALTFQHNGSGWEGEKQCS